MYIIHITAFILVQFQVLLKQSHSLPCIFHFLFEKDNLAQKISSREHRCLPSGRMSFPVSAQDSCTDMYQHSSLEHSCWGTVATLMTTLSTDFELQLEKS